MRLRGSSEASAARFLALRTEKPAPIEPPEPPHPPVVRPAWQPKHERMPITKEQIERLRADAIKSRDDFFARVCDRALRWDSGALNACKAAVYGLE